MLPPPRRLCLALALPLAFGGAAFGAPAGPPAAPAPPVTPVTPVTTPPVPPVVAPLTGAPVVTTGAVSQLAATSAQLTGRVNPLGDQTTYYFNYGPTTSYGSTTPAVSLPASTVPASVRAKVDTLTTGSLYHYQLVATNALGTTAGMDQTFTPTGGLSRPTVVTGPPTATDGTAATITGTLNPNGQPATYRFNYGTTSAYGLTTANQPVPTGSADMQVSATLTGLTPGLTYHYRIVATGIAGTSVGLDQLFIAGQAPVPPPPPTPPAVATGDVTDVTTVGAALWGTLNTNGQATNYTFEYGTTTSYGGATPLVTVGPGSLDQPVTGVLTGLTPETTYHVRLTATNVAGSTQGPDQVFTTLAKVPVRPPAPPPTTPGAPTPPKAPQTPPAGSGPSLPAGPGPAPPASAVVAAASTRPDAPRPVVSQLRVRPGSLLATPARRVACAPPR
jgi:hypothetical protein